MKNIFSGIFKLIFIGCLVLGAGLLYLSQNESKQNNETTTNKKALALKKHLLKFSKPQRVEITNLSKRLATDADEIKKISLSLDSQSKFYIAIDLFTDENDVDAPMIAQIKFYDLGSGNKVKEENINLE